MATTAENNARAHPEEEAIVMARMNHHRDVSEAEETRVRTMLSPVRVADANVELLTEGQEHDHAYVLLSGWACRYKMLMDGRRQITGFVLPGDFAGLRSSIAQQAGDTILTLTTCRYAAPSVADAVDLCRTQPELAVTLFWEMARGQSMLAEHVVSLGRRNAREKLVHLFLELRHRLDAVGLVNDGVMRMPLTQEILADTLGLSVVHVNRTLQRLKRDGLLHQEGNMLIFDQMERLEEIADFQPDYLDIEED